MKKAILYCRVASKSHDDEALNVQEQNLRNYAEMQGYSIFRVIKEICSGTSLNRPGINKIHNIIKNHKIDAVIAQNISRYARCSNLEILNFIEALAENGAKTITMMDGDLQKIIPILKAIA